ncbi:MAG: signal peptidase II [Legionellaceae bacterium]|nr:signal peptidase II [Legionellaceae bacterium]
MKKALIFCVSVVVVFLDQLTKYWALGFLTPYDSKPVFSMLSWTLAFNSGSAFSFLANSGRWHMWFFSGFSTLISMILLVWIVRLNQARLYKQAFALALILGGAIGNLIDRVRIGYVVDFIDVFYQSYHWPVFNLADSAICVGAVLLAIEWIREKST